MKKIVTLTISLLLCMIPAVANVSDEIYCEITEVDNLGGIPIQTVSRVASDNDGYLWFATWNGLNRYDGAHLSKIPMRMRAGDEPLSERFYDIKLSPKGNFWCIIDDRLVHFDTHIYIYTDISKILQNLPGLNDGTKPSGETVKVKSIIMTADSLLLANITGDKWVTIGKDENPANATISGTKPQYKNLRIMRTLGKTTIEAAGIDDCAYAGTVNGIDIVAGRSGDIMAAPHGSNDFIKAGHIDTNGRNLTYHDTDNSGNLWMGYYGKIFRISTGIRPYKELPVTHADKVRASMLSSDGRIWIAESDGTALGLYRTDGTSAGYLREDGSISDTYTPFGHKVYSLAEYPEGTYWVGTKPDGLIRYTTTPEGHTKRTGTLSNPVSVYDIVPDSRGRLWLASIDDGIYCIERPEADTPEAIRLTALPGYPAEARRCRRISIHADTLHAATTRGLLTAPLPEDPSQFKATFITAGNSPGQLSGVALSDVLATDGYLIAAGESSGINIGRGAPPVFETFTSPAGTTSDALQSLASIGNTGKVIAVGDNMIYVIDPGKPDAPMLKATVYQGKIRFTEPRPLLTGDSTLLLAHSRGALAMRSPAYGTDKRIPLVFTSVSIQNQPDSLLSASTDTLTLGADERNITLRFTALEYNNPEDITYSFRVDGNDWMHIGKTSSLTLLDIAPGTHRITLRSTRPDGSPAGNETEMTLVVKPKFKETLMAKILLTLLAMGIVATGVYLTIYIRRMKRRQRDTLEAYLRLMEEHTSGDKTQSVETPAEKTPRVKASEEDTQFMDKIAKYVEDNLGNPDISVDDMATALCTSRSSLTRKMKSLVGVTPADFLRQSRLKRAASLLRTSGEPIKNIAMDCGFSDLNYFSKCFKVAYGTTPSTYRKSQPED